MKIACTALFASILGTAAAGAQALPTASRQPIEVGAAFSFGSPGYQDTPTYIEGVSLFAHSPIKGRIGAQIDVHLDSYITPVDIGQNTYLIGPRVTLVHEDRVNIYAKVTGGFGTFQFQPDTYSPRSDSFGVFAFGGGIEYRVSQHINARAIDLEFQDWPGFPGGALHPAVASIGFAWRL